jgi:hypothetical protein
VLTSCGDPGWSTTVANESSQPLLVRLTWSDASRGSLFVLSPPRSIGAVGSAEGRLDGAIVEVMDQSCVGVAVATMHSDRSSIRISPDLTVSESNAAADDQASDLPDKDLLAEDRRCDSQPSAPPSG